MKSPQKISELLSGTDEEVIGAITSAVSDIHESRIIELLEALEEPGRFKNRLPLRLKIYAALAATPENPNLAAIALIRLLRRMGSRKDLPDLGVVPDRLSDYVEYICIKVIELLDTNPLSHSIQSLARATRSFRAGDIPAMTEHSHAGLISLDQNDQWQDPDDRLSIEKLLIAETGHELLFIASNARFRSGETDEALKKVELWRELIERWENLLGPMARQRYQYFQLVGQIQHEVGLPEQSIDSYARGLEYAPTPYRRAFLWLSLAQVEKELGRKDESWNHAVSAIEAWLDSPYPQAAAPWIEWLAADADTPEKLKKIGHYREKSKDSGVREINNVVMAMTRLYRLMAELRSGAHPSRLVPTLEELIEDLESAGSWPNLITLLATRAVVAGRLGDTILMDESIATARRIVSEKIAADSQPPVTFFLENAHSLALRNAGEYEEAFEALFERALDARMQYPGGIGPDEQNAFEALYYLGALAGFEPRAIENRVRAAFGNLD